MEPPRARSSGGIGAQEQIAFIQRFQRLLDRCRSLDAEVSREIDRLNAIPAASPRKAAEAETVRKRVIEQLRVHGNMSSTLEQLRRGSSHALIPEMIQQTQKMAIECAENLVALNGMCGRRPDDASA